VRSFVLQHLQEQAAGAAEQSRTNGAMLSESPARVLLMLARCTRSPFAPVRLPQPPIRRTRPRSSPTTCWHLMRKRRRSTTTVRAACYGSSTKVDNHRFTVVAPWYELTTLLRRTLIYTLGRSGSARRDLHGQLSNSSRTQTRYIRFHEKVLRFTRSNGGGSRAKSS
jgi:hypothetical protein